MAPAGMLISLVGGLVALALGKYGLLVLAILGFFVFTMIAGQSSPAQNTNVAQSGSKVDRYFALIQEIADAKKAGQIERMLTHCKQSIELLPAVIRSTKREFKSFDISSIPAITQGCIFWAVLGRADEIRAAQAFCKQHPDLVPWDEEFEQAYRRLNLASRIEEILDGSKDGYPQNQLKSALNESDGRFLSNTIHYMEAAGKLQRQKTDKSYVLFAA